jgi:hypothetical protein
MPHLKHIAILYVPQQIAMQHRRTRRKPEEAPGLASLLFVTTEWNAKPRLVSLVYRPGSNRALGVVVPSAKN